jgi:hypothetical protein
MNKRHGGKRAIRLLVDLSVPLWKVLAKEQTP